MKRRRTAKKEATMTETAPPWLSVMRTLTGTQEVSGPGANPVITGMTDEIARVWADVPGMETYCHQPAWDSDETAWCGVAAGYCLSEAGLMPPFGATDTDKFGWADSFRTQSNFINLGGPVLGAIVVMKREGGNHVTFLEEDLGSQIKCRGGNQSNSVNVATYDKSVVTGWMWPKDYPPPAVPRETIKRGSKGPAVAECQRILAIPADGDFGPTTEGAVKGFQSAWGLATDGVVGPQTWEALDELDARKKAGTEGLSDEEIAAVSNTARTSEIAEFSWPDRGRAPAGYIVGMALSYALATKRLDDDPAVADMSQADRGDPDEDVLSWFEDDLEDLGWDTSEDGADTLRTLFAIMIGLGMRESSGRYCEGRDMSASNTSSDTAEAGLFQTSWNIRSCASTISPLLSEFDANPNGFVDDFSEGVSPNGDELTNYGAGSDGAKYQFLSKYAPTFHVFVTAIGLRYLRQHWGPVNRNEVDLVADAYDLLIDVDKALSDVGPAPPEPEPGIPEVDVEVRAIGQVTLTVNDETVPAEPDPGTPTVAIDVTSTGGVRIVVDGKPYSESS